MTTIHIQSQIVNNWHDARTSASRPPHIRIYSDAEFFTSDGVLVPSGNPTAGEVYKEVTCTQSGTTVTIPAFDLDSTRDALALTRNAHYSFYFYAASGSLRPGAQISRSPFLSGITVPDQINSLSGCSPSGTCCTLDDLAAYNNPTPPLPPDTYPTFAVVRGLIQAALGTAQQPGGASKTLQYNADGVFGAIPDTIVNLLSTDVSSDTNTGGAQLVFQPRFHYTSASDFRSVGIGSRPIIEATAGGESLFYTPYWLLFGSRLSPIPAGTKGNPAGFEVNIFSNQTALDMSEALHAFGATIEGHGGAPLYGTALSYLIDTVPANLRAHNMNVAKNIAGGTQHGYYGSSSGSQSPTAIYSGGGTWNYGIDLKDILVNLGVFRAANNAPAFVARNAANSGDITVMYLGLDDRIVMGSNVIVDTSDAFIQVGSNVDGYLFQKVDSGGRLRFFRQGFGEVMNILGQNPTDSTTAMQLLVTKGAVTSLAPVVLGAIGSGGTGLRALCTAN